MNVNERVFSPTLLLSTGSGMSTSGNYTRVAYSKVPLYVLHAATGRRVLFLDSVPTGHYPGMPIASPTSQAKIFWWDRGRQRCTVVRMFRSPHTRAAPSNAHCHSHHTTPSYLSLLAARLHCCSHGSAIYVYGPCIYIRLSFFFQPALSRDISSRPESVGSVFGTMSFGFAYIWGSQTPSASARS